jgi:hypothetical protein
LIKNPAISKILISVGSKKLVMQAQALIIYHESKEDLNKLKKLLKIYLGVPIKFYLGPINYDNNQWFYDFQQGDQLALDLLKE